MDNYQSGKRYDVDMVLCIDATGSMSYIIDEIKECMDSKNKKVDSLRVKVIAFRDYYADSKAKAILNTPFFALPAEKADFKASVDEIKADGGGDIPEDGLEALAYAINSDWRLTNNKGRQIIVVWSDAGTHPLGEGPKMDMPDYPSKMPRSYSELSQLWENLDIFKKRLLLFTPEEENWSNICSDWENVIFYPSKAGQGLSDLNFDEILNVICNSI